MIQAILLGNAQDAGVPQAGCSCPNCHAAWGRPAARKLVSALALVDTAATAWWLIDVTPDFREQLHYMLTNGPPGHLAGLLITHAHMGHYGGLLHLGFEAMNARGLPLYGTSRLLAFLQDNAPWRQLVERGNVELRELAPGAALALTPGLSVQAVPVPHRDEASDTVAYLVQGAERRLLYLPDIDSWHEWAHPLRQVVAGLDVALLDGTFYSPNELPGRAASAIGHPLVTDTAERLRGVPAEVVFIHLNHSNPLHRPGPERDWLAQQGFRVGDLGDRWEL